jgi:hypothetical protein
MEKSSTVYVGLGATQGQRSTSRWPMPAATARSGDGSGSSCASDRTRPARRHTVTCQLTSSSTFYRDAATLNAAPLIRR